jgi:hypothetical protein
MMLAAVKASPIPAGVPAAMLTKSAMPNEPPTSCPVVFRPDSIPLSCSRTPVSTDSATVISATPKPSPAITIPGSTSVR